jgi:integrase
LFERWIAKAKPASSTVNRWRGVFLRLQSDFPNTSAAGLLPEQMQEWANRLIDSDRTAGTVANIWVGATRTVFAWAIDEKLISRNPFTGWRVKVPKKIRMRETKSFTDGEIETILSTALAIEVRSKTDAAKRWCPWLAAYSGARMGELTQLRGVDIVERDGIHAIKISPALRARQLARCPVRIARHSHGPYPGKPGTSAADGRWQDSNLSRHRHAER